MADPAFDPGLSRREALRRAASLLAAAPLDAGPNDARFLALHALGITGTGLLLAGDAPLGAAGAERLADALRRRLAGEPVARILGEWEFWGLTFRLDPETLVPRPDTETLVEAALALRRGRPPRRILDLGTGSGCILVALLGEWPGAHGVGIDRQPGAAAQARANAALNGVGGRAAFLVGDWAAPVGAAFDLVVSNPPYIPSAAIAGLSAEVRRHDPRAALDGGIDGLDPYRRILADLAVRPALLADGATLAFEVGHDQAGEVATLAGGLGFRHVATARDLAGKDRVVTMVAPGGPTEA